jgi:hypothetical protein
MGARDADEAPRLRRGRDPLNGRTLDVAVGWNKPTKPVAEQAVEGLRKPEDGTKRELGSPAVVDAAGDVAMRDRARRGSTAGEAAEGGERSSTIAGYGRRV